MTYETANPVDCETAPEGQIDSQAPQPRHSSRST